jgi:hypothetical protein
MVAGVLTGLSPASAATAACRAWSAGGQPPPIGTDDELDAVAVPSASEAWAVGSSVSGGVAQPLIEHWKGSAWTAVPSPVHRGSLTSVRSASPSSVWAVGTSVTSKGLEQTLILHWNGKTWQRVTSPDPGSGTDNDLTAVTATSTSNAWAVGGFGGSSTQSLILRWNGTRWQQVQTPVRGSASFLDGVAASSASNAWAVGYFFDGGNRVPLALHCH